VLAHALRGSQLQHRARRVAWRISGSRKRRGSDVHADVSSGSRRQRARCLVP
jgi:hypothetical protein